jgi:CheY-like chemotaxis protein
MKKVIMTKDVKSLLEREKSFLGRSGIRVLTAASNEKALALHKSVRADLIIARLDSPEMSGERLCSLIRDDNETRDVSLIMICSGADSDLERCVQCRANAFISSPIDSGLLLQEMHKLLHVSPRLSYRIPLNVQLRGESRSLPFSGLSEDIGASGMLFRSSALLFEGDIITCSFFLPDSPEITMSAEIVRFVGKEAGRDGNLYGIRFIDPNPRAVSALAAFIKNIDEAG